MAGYYPDSPAYRLAYDLDGTKVFLLNKTLGTSTELSSTQKAKLNDENPYTDGTDLSVASYDAIVFLFPESIDFVGYQYFGSFDYPFGFTSTLEYNSVTSSVTTNGLDGTWVTGVSQFINSGINISPNYRQAASPFSQTNVKAIRFNFGQAYSAFLIELFANPRNDTIRQILFWHPTLEQEVGPAYFDFGDVTVGTSETKTFRIKNLAPYIANNVTVSTNILTEKTPTISSQHLLSLDNLNWSTSVTLTGALNPGTVAPQTVYFKRSTLSNAALGVYSGRLHATVASWTIP